jgi:hypothetical protein
MSYEVMPDFTHDAVGTIPDDFVAVAGYVSGTPDIKWNSADWGKFTHAAVKLRYNQGYDATDLTVEAWDAIDMEQDGNGQWTFTPEQTADLINASVQAGIIETTVYADRSALALLGPAVKTKYGNGVWDGHVTCVLADWNLDEAEAATLLGTEVEGITCVGVQWASPTSNPNTILPGTNLTLSQANADLNVLLAGWKPNRTPGQIKPPVPVPVPPKPPVDPTPVPPTPTPVKITYGVVVYYNGTPTPVSKSVTSTDAGKTWA